MCFIRLLGWVILTMTLVSCGPRSLNEFEEEGEGVIRSLIQELQVIHTREQLLAESGNLQKQFDRLVNIMIAAEEYVISHPDLDRVEFSRHNHELSDRLRIELNRLYRVEGGCQIIEKCQEKALHRLDAFKKKNFKQKEENLN
jgi:hypothetical protein